MSGLDPDSFSGGHFSCEGMSQPLLLESEIMCAQAALVEQRLQVREGDLRVSYFSPNGDGVRLLPGVEQVSSKVTGALRTLPAAPIMGEAGGEQQNDSVVAEGMLVLAARDVEYAFPIIVRGDRSPDGSVTMSYYDRTETLLLQRSGDADTLNVRLEYTDKPLDTALGSAKFLELLATTSGVLFLELSAPVEGGRVVSERMEVLDLPFDVPESWLKNHRNRVRLLEGLREIWINTGVEIRYPSDTTDEEGLQNFNFVQSAVRGGWVALSLESLGMQVPDAQAHALLEELRTEGQVGKAFYLEVPRESYPVFGKEVDLGPSSRYLASAHLKTTQAEIQDQLSARGTADVTWEPTGGVPMHVFFDQWPKLSAESVRRELREYEILYGMDSERFEKAWEQREPWTQEVQDGSRWISLIEADEELAAES